MGVRRELSAIAWGGLVILAGLLSQAIMALAKPPRNRAELLGQGAAGLIFVIVGGALLVKGLLDRRR